jgi:hypothetical protein
MIKELNFEARFFPYMEKPPETDKKNRLESVGSTQRVPQEAHYELSNRTWKPCQSSSIIWERSKYRLTRGSGEDNRDLPYAPPQVDAMSPFICRGHHEI